MKPPGLSRPHVTMRRISDDEFAIDPIRRRELTAVGWTDVFYDLRIDQADDNGHPSTRSSNGPATTAKTSSSPPPTPTKPLGGSPTTSKP
jgi:hypothetical protein